MLGFTEKEIGHMTMKKFLTLYDFYKDYHDFKTKQGLFKGDKGNKNNTSPSSSLEWFED